jgi:hypothetical protein
MTKPYYKLIEREKAWEWYCIQPMDYKREYPQFMPDIPLNWVYVGRAPTKESALDLGKRMGWDLLENGKTK